MQARIGIIGSAGRMGQALAAAIVAAGDIVAGGIGRDDDPVPLARASQVLVDFSRPDALEAGLDAAIDSGTPMLVGTTGLAERHHWLIDHAAERIAVLQTGNTSLGINLLAFLVREAAARLGEDWDIEIVETHHRHKRDAPSGTALVLGAAAATARGIALADHSTRARSGGDGEGEGASIGGREPGAIGFAALRGGSVAGDHTVWFLGKGERLALSHLAENRAIFATGAIIAARWLIGKPAGRYTMAQVLGLDRAQGDGPHE